MEKFFLVTNHFIWKLILVNVNTFQRHIAWFVALILLIFKTFVLFKWIYFLEMLFILKSYFFFICYTLKMSEIQFYIFLKIKNLIFLFFIFLFYYNFLGINNVWYIINYNETLLMNILSYGYVIIKWFLN